jgi:hypothetical protein
MTARRTRHRRAKAGTSRKPDEEAVARSEARKIIRFGTVVYELFWDSGGPDAGAEYERVFRWRDKYAGLSAYSLRRCEGRPGEAAQA